MRFEKSSKESWIGWIVYSEVFLLATLMMLAMAMVFDAAFSRTTLSENELKQRFQELGQTHEELSVAKAEVDSELDHTLGELDSARTEIVALSNEKQQLNGKVATLTEEISELQTQISGQIAINRSLAKDKKMLELLAEQQKEMIAARQAELVAAGKKYAVLDQQYAELTTEKIQLEKKLAATTQVVAELEKTLGELTKEYQVVQADLKQTNMLLKIAESERDAFQKLAKSFPEKLKTAEAKISDLETKKKKLESEYSLLDSKYKILLARKNVQDKKFAQLTIEEQKLTSQVKELLALMGGKEDELKRLKIAMEELRTGAGRLRQELLGLKGDMKRVVFLFDRSGSMKNRWDYTAKIVQTWLSYLPVQHCAVLTFSDSVQTFPSVGDGIPLDKGMMAMQGEQGADNREKLATWLKRSPAGLTNTLAAFQAAYRYDDVSMIILFTDGAPRTVLTDRTATLDVGMRDKIYELCANHQIPINTVGLGDFYTNQELGTFLMKLAADSKGAFLGR